MVLEVGAHARHIGDHGNAKRLQERGGPEPRKLHELRRVERARREYHFAARMSGLPHAGAQVFDAGGALP